MGHKDFAEGIDERLAELIDSCIQMGVEEFYFCDHGEFDACVNRVLKSTKKRTPWIKRIFVLTYHPSVCGVREGIEFDELLYPFEKPVPPRFAIDRVNRQMIRHCDVLIACVYKRGNAETYLNIARKREERGEMTFFNIAE